LWPPRFCFSDEPIIGNKFPTQSQSGHIL
jgi:hypothetical protein